ncbi:uncharacterized protein LOC108667959 isoform X2 [Hyalella azteca]|uniref:Uncharacterized protein LOC108667959 isoform X2 n=1 Tax=Hyalella azteca TaxID=294128 RepID=A0A979FV33_HYAAZ|nr:uncharacterized protein LOC108667959 isoform X2 [Hyalella azteca]
MAVWLHVALAIAALHSATSVHGAQDSTRVTYRAAAAQFAPYDDWAGGGAKGILDTNLRTIAALARNASAQGADIIVFPEYGLTSTNLGANRSQLRELCQVLPEPGDARVPCAEHSLDPNSEMVQSLSCLALELDIYIVVDLAELVPQANSSNEISGQNSYFNKKDEQIMQGIKGENQRQKFYATETIASEEDFEAYNTQVVFDRRGSVVARYRKKHLFFESDFVAGNESDDTALFVTDFGVTFSLQVCFDIMYESPAQFNIVTKGVRDVAMSTAWIDELPFLTAPQIFRSFSLGLASNLIVSNLYRPAAGMLGSGIFHGDHNDGEKYTYDVDISLPTLLVDDVTTLVDAELMADFQLKEKILSDKVVGEMSKFLSSGDDNISMDFEGTSLAGLLNENFAGDIAGFLNSSKHLFDSENNVEVVLESMFKDVRQIVEWDRFSQRLRCSKVCQSVRSLLKHVDKCGNNSIHDISNNISISLSSISEVLRNKTNTPYCLEDEYLRDQSPDTQGDIPTMDCKSESPQYIIHENISMYSHGSLPLSDLPAVSSLKVCDGTFCCEVWYSYPVAQVDDGIVTNQSQYMLLVYNGTVGKGSGTYLMWTQTCGVVFCLNQTDVNSCAAVDEPHPEIYSSFRLLNITGNFDTNFVYPSVFNLNFELVDHSFWSFKSRPYELIVNADVENILTAVLFGRDYKMDP